MQKKTALPMFYVKEKIFNTFFRPQGTPILNILYKKEKRKSPPGTWGKITFDPALMYLD